MPPKKAARNRPLPKNDERNYRREKVMGDTYSNPPARTGDFTPNLINTGQYPLVRLTENYPLILSLYRSSWMIRKVIDTIANDMYQSFPILDSSISPEEITSFLKVIKQTRTLTRLRSACKWGRLFGGAGAIIVIDGVKDLMEPLVVEDIEVGAYKGLIPLDRWSGIIPGPEINSDINDPNGFGLPTYYNCIMDAGNVNIHHSRILRFTGRELPQWEVQVELYWGMSEVEIIFDELKKRDYSSWNIVSLLTRAQVLAVTDPQLATLMSGAGGTNQAFINFTNRMEAISQLMNNQGLMVLGKDSTLHQTSYGFGGVADVYHEFMRDFAAASDMPYEIIFGRESGGSGGGGNFSSNGQSSLQLYDNLIEQRRNSEGDPVIDQLLPVIAMSTWGKPPDDLTYHWAPIRSLSNQERYDLGKSLTESVLMSYNADLITKKEARKELAQQSGTNGLYSNITPESLAETEDKYASEIQQEQAEEQMAQQMAMQSAMQGGEAGGGTGGEAGPGAPPGTRPGEHIPVEAKPVGVKGLRYHPSKRIQTGAGQKTSAASAEQGLRHGIKHSMKNETKTFDGTKLGMAEQMRKTK
jgi:phage-related protein (TIGR01555 family)